MKIRDCLLSLDMMRDFVARVVPQDVYMKNLVIDHIETSNRRLWALRASIRMDEERFAALFNVTIDEYHQYERAENPIPPAFLKSVASRLSVPIDWLLCRCPMLPIPEAEFKDPPQHIE
jgi:hypothetical protein